MKGLVSEPKAAPTLWGDVFNWAKFTLRDPSGRAIVFAVSHRGGRGPAPP